MSFRPPPRPTSRETRSMGRRGGGRIYVSRQGRTVTEIEFFVKGRPVQQGSKDIGPHGQLREAAPGLKAWRGRVKLAAMKARIAAGHATFTSATRVDVVFFVPRPVDPRDPDYPTGPPDLDKYARAIGDALTQAGVYRDDSLTVEIHAYKLWARGEVEGALVHVSDEPSMGPDLWPGWVVAGLTAAGLHP